MIRLTDEEISEAKKGHTAIMELHPSVFEDDIAIAKAQLKKVVEWLKSCQTLPDAFDSPEAGEEIFAIDWVDWQALLEEVK